MEPDALTLPVTAESAHIQRRPTSSFREAIPPSSLPTLRGVGRKFGTGEVNRIEFCGPAGEGGLGATASHHG